MLDTFSRTLLCFLLISSISAELMGDPFDYANGQLTVSGGSYECQAMGSNGGAVFVRTTVENESDISCSPEEPDFNYNGPIPLGGNPGMTAHWDYSSRSEHTAVGSCGVNQGSASIYGGAGWLASTTPASVSFGYGHNAALELVAPEAWQCSDGSWVPGITASGADEFTEVFATITFELTEPGYILVQTSVASVYVAYPAHGDEIPIAWGNVSWSLASDSGFYLHDSHEVYGMTGEDVSTWGSNEPRAFFADPGIYTFSMYIHFQLNYVISATDSYSNGATCHTVATLRFDGSPLPTFLAGDVDGDGDTDLSDLAAVLGSYGHCVPETEYNPLADLDGDGCVDLADLGIVLANMGS